VNYAIEMNSGAIIYVPSFIKIGSGIQKLIGGGIHIQKHRRQSDLINLLLFFQNKESRLKNGQISLMCYQIIQFIGKSFIQMRERGWGKGRYDSISLTLYVKSGMV
jgi:hypothetical protein